MPCVPLFYSRSVLPCDFKRLREPNNSFQSFRRLDSPDKILTVMQQEDDLRGLAKVVGFMRAISLLFIVIHIYWYAYEWFEIHGWSVPLADRILSDFQHNTGLFSQPVYTKLFSLLFLALSCLGTRGIRTAAITWREWLRSERYFFSAAASRSG